MVTLLLGAVIRVSTAGEGAWRGKDCLVAELAVLVRRSVKLLLLLLLNGVTVKRMRSWLVLSPGLMLVLLRRGVVQQVT